MSDRSQPFPNRSFHYGELVVDPIAYAARYRGRLLNLCPIAFRLLTLFMANPDRLFDRADLIGHMNKAWEISGEHAVNVWVSRLRRVLREQGVPNPLQTVRMQGYVWGRAS